MCVAVAASPLHKALQQAVENVAPVPHQPDVLSSAVHTLPVQNGPFEHVTELLPRAWGRNRKEGNQTESQRCKSHGREENRPARTQEVWSDEIHHAPVLDQVVLEWVARQDHAAPGLDVLQGLRRAGVTVLDPVAFVANDHIWTGPG